MAKGNSARRPRAENLQVDPTGRPGWVAASLRELGVGQEVYCVGGAGVLAAILGKTGDGSRLLEIQLADRTVKPYFAAASNVLVAP